MTLIRRGVAAWFLFVASLIWRGTDSERRRSAESALAIWWTILLITFFLALDRHAFPVFDSYFELFGGVFDSDNIRSLRNKYLPMYVVLVIVGFVLANRASKLAKIPLPPPIEKWQHKILTLLLFQAILFSTFLTRSVEGTVALVFAYTVIFSWFVARGRLLSA